MGVRIPFKESVPEAFPLIKAETTLKASRQTTSSRATICRSVSTNSPFALY